MHLCVLIRQHSALAIRVVFRLAASESTRPSLLAAAAPTAPAAAGILVKIFYSVLGCLIPLITFV